MAWCNLSWTGFHSYYGLSTIVLFKDCPCKGLSLAMIVIIEDWYRWWLSSSRNVLSEDCHGRGLSSLIIIVEDCPWRGQSLSRIVTDKWMSLTHSRLTLHILGISLMDCFRMATSSSSHRSNMALRAFSAKVSVKWWKNLREKDKIKRGEWKQKLLLMENRRRHGS